MTRGSDAAAPIRVLVIEDDKDVGTLNGLYLSAIAGFEQVGWARSVAQAVAMLEREQPDLVLLDVFLPDGTGIDLLRRLRQARPDSFDVILVTAASEAGYVSRAARLGVVDYLVKPFGQAEFTRRLARYRDARTVQNSIAQGRPMTQAEVDAYLLPGAEQPLPKGLAAATSATVRETLREGGAMTATDVSERVGISRVSARRYLEHLVRDGLVVSRPRYGGTGRPRTEYVWRDDGQG